MRLIGAIILLATTAMAQPLPPMPGLTNLVRRPQYRQVALAWNPSPDTNVAGNCIYYGTSPRCYTNMVWVGDRTTASISNLVVGVTYYFAATARNILGLESDYSNELAYTVPRPVYVPRTNVVTVTVVTLVEASSNLHAWLPAIVFTNTLSITNPPGSAAFFRGVLAPLQSKMKN